MSRIHELGPNLKDLPRILAEYESAFSSIEDNLTLRGKTLDFALKEQSTWPIYYEQRRVELRSLVKYMSAQVDKVRGKLSRELIYNANRAIGERMIGTLVDAEDQYIQMHELYLEVEELYEKYAAVQEAFNKRGFALRDITTSRVHQIQDGLL